MSEKFLSGTKNKQKKNQTDETSNLIGHIVIMDTIE